MSSKLDEFKAFVKEYPLLKEEVLSKKRTWQSIYEEWYLDNSHNNWKTYQMEEKQTSKDNSEDLKEEDKKKEGDGMNTSGQGDLVKMLFNYARKIDTNTINKSIDSVQKVVGLFSTISGASANKEKLTARTRDPLFDRRFDDWY